MASQQPRWRAEPGFALGERDTTKTDQYMISAHQVGALRVASDSFRQGKTKQGKTSGWRLAVIYSKLVQKEAVTPTEYNSNRVIAIPHLASGQFKVQ